MGRQVCMPSRFPYDVIRHREETVLRLEDDSRGLSITGKFFNKDGKIVCEIVKNELFVSRNHVFRKEQTENRLTVFDDEGQRVIDVQYLNPQAIQITGRYYLRDGVLVEMGDGGLTVDGISFGTALGGLDGRYGFWLEPPRQRNQ